jgi:DNA-binding NtrC family response regulator
MLLHNQNNEIEVLIVEDEIDICYLLTGILNKQHVQTAFATSLFDAQKALKKGHTDVLFIDNNLPDGYGVDFIPIVKREYPGTKIIMMTAHDTGADKQKALKQGADFFIGKPFTHAMIVNTLNAVLDINNN